MSRAFIKESDAEASAARDDAEHEQKHQEWLAIQRRKLDFLLNDPKARAIDPAKRERWIAEIRSALDR